MRSISAILFLFGLASSAWAIPHGDMIAVHCVVADAMTAGSTQCDSIAFSSVVEVIDVSVTATNANTVISPPTISVQQINGSTIVNDVLPQTILSNAAVSDALTVYSGSYNPREPGPLSSGLKRISSFYPFRVTINTAATGTSLGLDVYVHLFVP